MFGFNRKKKKQDGDVSSSDIMGLASTILGTVMSGGNLDSVMSMVDAEVERMAGKGGDDEDGDSGAVEVTDFQVDDVSEAPADDGQQP